MDISVRARHVEVPQYVKEHAQERLSRLEKFLGMDHAEVRFTEERNPRIADREICEVTLHGHGHVVRAKASATEICAAVDRAAGKLEHSLEKLKGKLVGRSHPRRNGHNGHASNGSGPATDGLADLMEADDPEDGSSRIIRTKSFDMKPMTPDEAALQMELLGHSFFLFTSSENGRASVVYHREDGEIGMIEAV
jgi:putative sigma-54 modulation protein